MLLLAGFDPPAGGLFPVKLFPYHIDKSTKLRKESFDDPSPEASRLWLNIQKYSVRISSALFDIAFPPMCEVLFDVNLYSAI